MSFNFLKDGFLDSTFAGNTVLTWIVAIGVVLLAVLAVRILKTVLLKSIGRFAKKTSNWADDVIVDVVKSTGLFAYFAVAVFAAVIVLDFPGRLEPLLKVGATIILLVQAGIWIQEFFKSLMSNWVSKRETKRNSTIAAGVTFAGKLVTWTIIVLLILSNMGVKITAVIAGLGVGGIAVALAVQGVLGDLFASLSMYFDRPFDIGDFVIIDGYLGVVDKIGLRTTRLKSLGGEQIIFANGDIVKSRIRNYARMEERRIVFSFGIEYNLPAEKVERAAALVKEVITETPDTRLDRVHFKAYGNYSLDFEAVYYVLSPDYNLYMDRQHAINMGMYRRFEQEGITFAFPTQTIHLKDGANAIGGPSLSNRH